MTDDRRGDPPPIPNPRVRPGANPAPPTDPKRPSNGTAAACLAAAAACAALTAGYEGFVAKAKPDPIGISTGCFGERVDQSDLDPSRIYTRSECTDRLRARLAKEYAPKLLEPKCLPELAAPERKHEFAAMLDTAYNAGPAAICRSPMARQFKINDWAAGCAALRNFYTGSVTARPVKGAMDSRRISSGPNKGKWFNRFRGLVNRRAFFAELCMKPEEGRS